MLALEARFLPSMMDMCTALRRVRGTLLRRGPCVMDGQLLLGTRPALQGQTQRVRDGEASRRRETVTVTSRAKLLAGGCCSYHGTYGSTVSIQNRGAVKKRSG